MLGISEDRKQEKGSWKDGWVNDGRLNRRCVIVSSCGEQSEALAAHAAQTPRTNESKWTAEFKATGRLKISRGVFHSVVESLHIPQGKWDLLQIETYKPLAVKITVTSTGKSKRWSRSYNIQHFNQIHCKVLNIKILLNICPFNDPISTFLRRTRSVFTSVEWNQLFFFSLLLNLHLRKIWQVLGQKSDLEPMVERDSQSDNRWRTVSLAHKREHQQ